MKKFFIITLLLLIGGTYMILPATPSKKGIEYEDLTIDSTRLINDVAFLSDIQPARNYLHPEILDSIANYISSELSNADTVFFQTYEIDGVNYHNVVARYGTQHKRKLIVGAHYDVCHELPGADDNASGIAGLLEIGRNLQSDSLSHQIELVAYTLEEPPFFRTPQMGSAVHANSVTKENVIGMICLEMIGYFSHDPKSQEYPVKALKVAYPSVGNYIAVVGRMGQKKFTKQMTNLVNEGCKIGVESINAPKSLPGIDFSDHLNYWARDIDAIMVTNTAFYRNKNYHTEFDVKEKLNYTYMAWVVEGVLNAACNFEE